jgi:hypothetical protein
MNVAAPLPMIGNQGGEVLDYALPHLRCEGGLHRLHLGAQLLEFRVLLG